MSIYHVSTYLKLLLEFDCWSGKNALKYIQSGQKLLYVLTLISQYN